MYLVQDYNEYLYLVETTDKQEAISKVNTLLTKDGLERDYRSYVEQLKKYNKIIEECNLPLSINYPCSYEEFTKEVLAETEVLEEVEFEDGVYSLPDQ